MSAITKPYVHSTLATGGDPVEIENILTFFKRSIPTTNVMNPSNPSGTGEKHEIVFVENSVSPGRKEIVWSYGADEAQRDADYTALLAGLSTYMS